jgi:hypothetical protein
MGGNTATESAKADTPLDQEALIQAITDRVMEALQAKS